MTVDKDILLKCFLALDEINRETEGAVATLQFYDFTTCPTCGKSGFKHDVSCPLWDSLLLKAKADGLIPVKEKKARKVGAKGGIKSKVILEDSQKQKLIGMLNNTNFSVKDICTVLGVSKSTFYAILKRYGLHQLVRTYTKKDDKENTN